MSSHRRLVTGVKRQPWAHMQWAPTLTAHDPSNVLTLQNPAGGTTTIEADGSSAGVAAPSAVGRAIWAGVTSSQGVAAPTGVGRAVWAISTASTGATTPAASAAAVSAGVTSSAGSTTPSASSGAIAGAVTTSLGAAAASANTSAIAGFLAGSIGLAVPAAISGAICGVRAIASALGFGLGDGENIGLSETPATSWLITARRRSRR